MMLYPLDNISIALLSNMDDITDAYLPLALYIFDVLMGYDTWISESNICNELPDLVARSRTQARTSAEYAAPSPARASSSQQRNSVRANAADYVGSYTHPAYGSLSVSSNATGLFFQWGAYYGPLTQASTSGEATSTEHYCLYSLRGFYSQCVNVRFDTLLILKNAWYSQTCFRASVIPTMTSAPSHGCFSSIEI